MFDVQSDLNDVISYHLQLPEERLYTGVLQIKWVLDQKGVLLVENEERRRLFDGEK